MVYTITLTQEELSQTDFDAEDSSESISQINDNISDLVSGDEGLFIGLEFISGCLDANACNFDVNANIDSLCIYASGCDTCSGEQDGTGFVVDNDADDDGVCDADEVLGCTNSSMYNYNPLATDDDGACYPFISGCMDATAYNYDAPIGDNLLDVNTK